MNYPLISILMYAGEYSGLFRRAIESCLYQRYFNWELLILVDTHSVGYRNYVSYFERADDRINAFYLDEEIGQNEALSVLLKYARGDYFTLFSPCDFYASEDALEMIAEKLQGEADYDLLIPGFDVVIEGNKTENKYIGIEDRVIEKNSIKISEFLSKEHIYSGFCFFRRAYVIGRQLDFNLMGVERFVVTSALLSDRTYLLNELIYVLDKENFRVQIQSKAVATANIEPSITRLYIWGKGNDARFLPALVDTEKVFIEGYVLPDEDVEEPEALWGYPAYKITTVMEKGFDQILAMDTQIYEYFPDKEKIAIISDTFSWRAFLMSPDTFFTRKVANNLIKCGKRVDGIITGMSYVQRGLLPQLLSKTMLMAAAPCQDMYYDKNSFLYYHSRINNGNGVEYAVIGISPYEFRYDESKSTINQFRCLVYYDMQKRTHHYELDENWLSYVDLGQNRVSSLLIPEYIDILSNNYCNFQFKVNRDVFDINKCSDDDKKMVMDNLHSIADKPYVDSVEEITGYFEDYLSFLCANRVKTIVLLPAFSKIFKDVFPRSIVDEELDIIENMKKKYDFTFLNLYDDNDFDDNAHFADEDHLNVYGAMIMTRKLDECLARI